MKPEHRHALGGLIQSRTTRRKLRWRIIAVLLLAALIPIALAGFGSWVVFGNLLEDKSLELMRSMVQGQAASIESYLQQRLRLLQLAARSHSLADLSQPYKVERLLEELNQSSDRGFVDLGVIDSAGNHVAYHGPYNLADRNYRGADWFREVMVSGTYMSDVFLGFRQVPHCIVAIKVVDDAGTWLLRATINSVQLDRLVQSGALGESADAYIVNQAGEYQTSSRHGSLLERSPLLIPDYRNPLQEQRVEEAGLVKIRVTNWILNGRWLLVVENDQKAVRAPVDRAITDGALVVALAVFLLVVATFLATWHLTGLIERSEAEREEITRAFMRSAKLASIGELATGLAHEINNPLAIISAEQTNIADLLSESATSSEHQRQMRESVARCKTQVNRCANITGKMLQFGRKRDSSLEPTDLAARLEETVALLKRHARVRNISISREVEDNLPRVLVDPLELEQVVVNLINNAVDAMPSGGKISIDAAHRDRKVQLRISDTGSGMSNQQLERMFEPFYTTKPPGKGTGLGLSVCYGMVQFWGGRIWAESTEGQGTTVTVELPVPTYDDR